MEVISTRRYEARPPVDSHASVLVDPSNSVATVKEEEWETRKKKEITTTRQIETRVKRQVVLEDGEVVVDSGPLVTTNTTEDVEQQEHTTQERRTTGDEPQKVEWPATKNGPIVQKELNETIVKSREETEELLETEDRQQLGDITDEAYQQAVRNNRGDLRLALAESSRSSQLQRSHSSATNSAGPRVVQHTTRSNKVVDTERTLERSELKHDGQIVTERKTTVEHEEIKDDEVPEGVPLEDEVRETRKEASQRFVKRRDEDLVDYVSPSGERLAREMRFVSETTEAERTGDWQPDTSPAKLLRGSRLPPKHGLIGNGGVGVTVNGTTTTTTTAAAGAASRADALTRKPLDLEEEDEARKVETSKWLESHFGSESRSSRSGSLDGHIDDLEETTAQRKHSPTTNTSYINVTMKSSVSPQYRHNHHNNHNGHISSHNGHSQLKQQHQTGGAGYFHGISEWSERYHSTEKQTSVTRTKSPSPQQYIMETTSREQTSSSRLNGHRSSPDSPRIQHKDTSYSPRSYDQQQQQQQQHSSSITRQMHQRHSPPHERPKAEPPSPPLRRKAREQVMTSSTTGSRTERSNQYNGGSSGNLLREQERERERSSRELLAREREAAERSASPVHVVQRTWESRSRDERQHQQQQLQQQSYKMHNGSSRTLHYSNSNGHAQHMQRVQHSPHRSNSNRRHKRSPSASRSISPSPVRRTSADKNDGRPRPSKSPSPSKYKIGESFRKLVGKLRSGSSERRKQQQQQQRPPTSSQSQLTQTDDGSTYLQYNSVDRNVPLGQDYEADSPPERPPRPTKYRSPSPRQQLHTEKIIHEHKEASSNIPHQQQQPIHRYYLGEDPFGGSIYGKEKGYTHSKPISRHRTRLIEYDYSGEPSSLGRFSKSTSRLAYEYGYNGGKEHELRGSSVQTLPRKMHHHSPTNATLTNNNSSYYHNGSSGRHHHSSSSSSSTTRRLNNVNGSSPTSAKRYGSMINISFNKNGSPKTTTHYVHHVPPKPERSYKSSLSRSKSFNVEIADDGAVLTNPRGNITPTNGGHLYSNGYSSNGYANSAYRNGSPHVVSSGISSSTPRINKLRETPPLKSPGILASISRSNRDLVRNGRRDY